MTKRSNDLARIRAAIPCRPLADRLVATYASMMRRCFNPADANYHNYGGRGISVSAELQDRERFVLYVHQLPSCCEGDRTLDRVDNERGYEVGNLRWATKLEQAHNRRTLPNESVAPVGSVHFGFEVLEGVAHHAKWGARVYCRCLGCSDLSWKARTRLVRGAVTCLTCFNRKQVQDAQARRAQTVVQPAPSAKS